MVLLDTYTLLRLISDPSQLSSAAVDCLSDPAQILSVSAISAFETGVLFAKKRISLGSSPEVWFSDAISDYPVKVISVSWQIAISSTQLPPIHGDPMDRIILATAISQNIPIISPDRQFAAYPNVQVIW